MEGLHRTPHTEEQWGQRERTVRPARSILHRSTRGDPQQERAALLSLFRLQRVIVMWLLAVLAAVPASKTVLKV